jgi:hypothetical protein
VSRDLCGHSPLSPIAPLMQSSLPLDRIERGHELCPGFVDLMEFPSRFARSERDEEATAQAGNLRMTAKPTDGLLVCLAAVRAANLIIKNDNSNGDSCWVFFGSNKPSKEKSVIVASGDSYVRYWPFVSSDATSKMNVRFWV